MYSPMLAARLYKYLTFCQFGVIPLVHTLLNTLLNPLLASSHHPPLLEMAPAKFLQTHNVESLGRHIQNKEERRNKRELERRKGEQGQETPSQPPMVALGSQAILKTEPAVPTEARTKDLSCTSSLSLPDFDSQGIGNPTDPLSATDSCVGTAARKDLQLTRAANCKGSETAPCSFKMANMATNTGNSLTPTPTNPPLRDEALVDPGPGPLLLNRQGSRLSTKQATLQGPDVPESYSPVLHSASRSLEALDQGIAVESHGNSGKQYIQRRGNPNADLECIQSLVGAIKVSRIAPIVLRYQLEV